jgi:C-terminal processing protease CtpA/Prc
LQGLLDRLAPGVSIFSQPPQTPAPSPFLAEVIDKRIGYLRLGSLVKGNVDQMDAALQDFNSKMLKSVVLDLRATPESSDFDLAAEVTKRFCPKGKVLFIVKKTNAKQERIMTSNQDPSFSGLLIVLADKETAGAAEAIAAVLRFYVNAMVIGHTTAGEAVEFSDLPLHSGKILRVAVAEVVLPGNISIFPGGVKPDLPVEMSADSKHEIFRLSQEKWDVSEFIYETDRPHLNEAALVAGRNPELDAMEAAQRAKSSPERPKAPLHDVVLQRALDFVTSLGILGNKPPPQAAPTQP